MLKIKLVIARELAERELIINGTIGNLFMAMPRTAQSAQVSTLASAKASRIPSGVCTSAGILNQRTKTIAPRSTRRFKGRYVFFNFQQQ